MIGRTIGQYQVIDKIGEGGMGAVYKAEDTTLHRLVALKTLAHSLSEDPEAKERFVREAQAASALNHPNITTVFELVQDEEDDSQLICMEYIEGKTIRDMVETGRVSVRKAIDIIIGCRGPGSCPQQRHPPPGREECEYHGLNGGPGEGDGLRAGSPGDEEPAHPDRHHHGHPLLLQPRAD